jgi:ferredoxin--NADP+ reductase
MFPIRDAHRLAPAITRFVVEAPLVARAWRPGQFIVVRVARGGERIPLTIVEAEPQAGLVTLIVQAVGKTTRQLCALGPGDSILDLLGPLGNPSPLEKEMTVACVGGGVGTAPVYPIARALKVRANIVHGLVGARSADLLVLEREMARCCDSLAVTTDDGSRGRKALVTEALRELLDREPLDAVYASGPLPMMRAVAETTRPFGVRTWASLNPIMLDGTGMCGGCRVTVAGAPRFACVDGPEFDAHAVDFEELMRRNTTYADMEREADERFLRAEAAHAASTGHDQRQSA